MAKKATTKAKGTKQEKSPDEIQLSELLDEFKIIKEEFLKAFNSDRKDIDKFITRFSNRVKDPESAKQYYVEAITSLLATKANTGMNAIKLLDSVAKMLSATKNHSGLNNANNGLDLAQLLGDDDDDDVMNDFDPDNP